MPSTVESLESPPGETGSASEGVVLELQATLARSRTGIHFLMADTTMPPTERDKL
jgi:hypothetical protein